MVIGRFAIYFPISRSGQQYIHPPSYFQGDHPEDCQVPGRGHQDLSNGCREQPGAAGSGGSECRHDHHATGWQRQTWSRVTHLWSTWGTSQWNEGINEHYYEKNNAFLFHSYIISTQNSFIRWDITNSIYLISDKKCCYWIQVWLYIQPHKDFTIWCVIASIMMSAAKNVLQEQKLHSVCLSATTSPNRFIIF